MTNTIRQFLEACCALPCFCGRCADRVRPDGPLHRDLRRHLERGHPPGRLPAQPPLFGIGRRQPRRHRFVLGHGRTGQPGHEANGGMGQPDRNCWPRCNLPSTRARPAITISGPSFWDVPGSTSLDFELTEDFPLVTLVAMIAPSPDWFIGVRNLDLRPAASGPKKSWSSCSPSTPAPTAG